MNSATLGANGKARSRIASRWMPASASDSKASSIAGAVRLRAFPFAPSVAEFIAGHDQVFVVEQNRDAQMRTLLINELEIDPARLTAVLHYDGTPITARFITQAITKNVHAMAVAPRKEKSKS